MIGHRSYAHNLSSCEILLKPERKKNMTSAISEQCSTN